MSYDIDEIRKKLANQKGKKSDPDEFKPERAQEGTPIKYRFFILPPLRQGETCKGGKAKADMPTYSLSNGFHWINKKPYACPRVSHLHNDDCPVCQMGFDLLGEMPGNSEEIKAKRKKVIKDWMPSSSNMVNIYFPDVSINPEELRGKVKYFNAPKTCSDMWEAAINRDSMGDPEDPQAFGVIFDENAAFLFQLEAIKQYDYNSYKTSKFITGTGPVPIVKLENGKPNLEAIQAILDARIDLTTKVGVPDKKELKEIVNRLVHGDDSGDDSGFSDEQPTKQSTKSETKVETKVETKAEPKEEVLKERVETKAEDKKEQKRIQVESEPDDNGNDDEISRLLAQLNDE